MISIRGVLLLNMASSSRLNILVIDSDAGGRTKLQHAAMSLSTFHKVYLASSLNEALVKTDDVDLIHVAAVSHRFPQAEVSEFIAKAKESKRGRDWVYIAVVQAVAEETEQIAANMLGGFDGFLCEPYSADTLREMAETTARVQNENLRARQQAAMTMILSDVSRHLDALTFFLAQERDSPIARRKLEESAAKLRKFLTPDARDAYVEAAIVHFESARLPLSTCYRGVSKRIKQRLTAKMTKHFADEYIEK